MDLELVCVRIVHAKMNEIYQTSEMSPSWFHIVQPSTALRWVGGKPTLLESMVRLAAHTFWEASPSTLLDQHVPRP